MNNETDEAIGSMRMLVFAIMWSIAVAAGFVAYLFKPELSADLPAPAWAAFVAAGLIYIVVDAWQDYLRDRRAVLDTARLDAIESLGLVIAPPKANHLFRVLREKEDAGEGEASVDVLGAGGPTVREAIDSALLQLDPPRRRATDPKE